MADSRRRRRSLSCTTPLGQDREDPRGRGEGSKGKTAGRGTRARRPVTRLLPASRVKPDAGHRLPKLPRHRALPR